MSDIPSKSLTLRIKHGSTFDKDQMVKHVKTFGDLGQNMILSEHDLSFFKNLTHISLCELFSLLPTTLRVTGLNSS